MRRMMMMMMRMRMMLRTMMRMMMMMMMIMRAGRQVEDRLHHVHPVREGDREGGREGEREGGRVCVCVLQSMKIEGLRE
jgi:hypothetical protein